MGAKIATCCYCGTRAVLVFDRSRHELSCGSCGAPLHKMKAMPLARAPVQQRWSEPSAPLKRYKSSKKKRVERPLKRRGKSLAKKAFEELWDVIEDIFD